MSEPRTLSPTMAIALTHALNALIFASRDVEEGAEIPGGQGIIDFVSDHIDIEALGPLMNEHLATKMPVDTGMVNACFAQAERRRLAEIAETSEDPADQQVPGGNDGSEAQPESSGAQAETQAQAATVEGVGTVTSPAAGADASGADSA